MENKTGEDANHENADSFQECTHSLRIDSLCAMCGREVSYDSKQLLPALHNSDKLLQTAEMAKIAQKKINKRLKSEKKMILILDLDQTILHTTHEECDCDFVFRMQNVSLYVKFRPHLQYFLEEAIKIFEIHIYTMGTREYARRICDFIDPEGVYFGKRIVSRSENFRELTKSIGRITCISKNVVILDDRLDVWNYSKNLIPIRPFWYHDKIDINDPNSRKSSYVEEPVVNRDEPKDEIARKLDINDKEDDIARISNVTSTSQDQQVVSGDNSAVNNSAVNISLANSTVSNCISHRIKSKCIMDDPSTAKRIKLFNPLESLKDRELLRVLKIMKKVHKKFFKTNKHVRKLLRIKEMRKMRIAASSRFFLLVAFTGAKLDFRNPLCVIENEEAASRLKALNITGEWLVECAYRKCMVEYDHFVISDYRAVDEYQKDLEEEFFN